jgi:hypothetical protein
MKNTKKTLHCSVLVNQEEVFSGNLAKANEKVTQLLKENKSTVFLKNHVTKKTVSWKKDRYQPNYHKEEVAYTANLQTTEESTAAEATK